MFVLFLAPLIEMISMAALTGVMFMVVVGTFEWASIRMFRRMPTSDMLVMVLVAGYTVFMHDLASAVILGRDCVDGTSNTLMVGERSVLGKAALWPGPRSNYQESDVLADGSYASPINRSETGYSSRHANGIVHFLLCDGSARAIHESLDSNDKTDRNMGLLQKLSARDDGLVVGQF